MSKHKEDEAIPISVLAGELYERYCKSVGGKAYNGDKLPTWEEFFNDEGKKLQAKAWLDVAYWAVKRAHQNQYRVSDCLHYGSNKG